MPQRKNVKTIRRAGRPPFECVALLLQGGGALGAYQAGVYQALAEADLQPDWVAGISIGAINSALIAGNPPESRVERLRAFWEEITDQPGSALSDLAEPLFRGNMARSWLNGLSATNTLMSGAPGFFEPRRPPPMLQPAGSIGATSYYDTTPLKATLERLVDFDRINAAAMRFSVGAVNVRTGNFVYFDTNTHHIGPEHVMASGALPPGFTAVEIEGEYYWDGGLISNTPLTWVTDAEPRQDTLAFQVDLWSSRGNMPNDLAEIGTRTKEIQYSSRTRANTDTFKRTQRLRNALAELMEKLPPEMKETEAAKLLATVADHKVFNIIQLVYRSKTYEGNTRDYEFSRRTMEEHWTAGYNDAVRTLRHPEVLERPDCKPGGDGVFTFDLAFDGRE